ncbi:hypothetical protein KR074_010366 [Drosophila pseudoananassae]|nr:hypothetical protein KR074_010366 [Drosophila pseudoananassae]
MRAGKKQAADSGKTRPCIVYVRNIREERPGPGRPRKATQQQQQQRLQQQLKQEQEQYLRETRGRRAGGGVSATAAIHERQPPGIALRTRQVATPPVRRQHQIVSPPSPQRKAKDSTMAKRRNTNLLLGNPIQKVGGLSSRRITTHTEPTASRAQTPKMFKSKHQPVAMSPPPTIAASRSRRSIKPNPKYTSEDMVTPKYLAALANESGSSPSSVGRPRSKPMYRNSNDDMNDLLDLDEDDDDELADAAFNPQLHKSDDDDDDDLSEGEFEEELRRPKLPPVKRGRGRPPKASTLANTTGSSVGNTSVASKMGASAGRPAPSSLQQMRRNMAANIARNNASLTEGSQISTAKRKLEINDNDSPVARKRMVLSSMGGSGQRSVPVVNGATKMGGHGGTTIPQRSKMGQLRMVPQSSSVTFKVNTGSGNRSVPGNSRSAGGGGHGGASSAASDSKHNKSEEGDDVPTFTIVNIDDIINQDDVLISRANINAAAAASAGAPTGGTAGKKLPVGRPRTRGIPPNSTNAVEKKAPPPAEKLSPSSVGSSLNSLNPPKRMKILASNSSSNTANKSHSGYNQNKNILIKPQPRILNTEMGKKTQTMKPLMNMGKELCPTDIDTEEDELEPDLDLDDDEPPATIVTRKNVKAITLTSTPHSASSGKWNNSSTTTSSNNNNNNNSNNRRNILSTASASSVNARTDRKISKVLGESGSGSGSGELTLFKKPGISPQRRSKENHQQKDDLKDSDADAGGSETHKSITNATTISSASSSTSSSHPKYFPPETTTYCEEDGRVVKKITCYETWHVISTARDSPAKTTRQQRTCLELALVKLANVATRIKVPSSKWTSKVTLYKVSPSLMQRQTMTIFTGDLKVYNIPEEDRHKYQPSCVLFRRSAVDRAKCRVPYDRAIIFKNKCFYANIDGKHVNLLGAPETVSTLKDVEILLDIVDHLTLDSDLVEMVNTAK